MSGKQNADAGYDTHAHTRTHTHTHSLSLSLSPSLSLSLCVLTQASRCVRSSCAALVMVCGPDLCLRPYFAAFVCAAFCVRRRPQCAARAMVCGLCVWSRPLCVVIVACASLRQPRFQSLAGPCGRNFC